MLVEQGLASSRTRAQALILAGDVVMASDGRRIDKPGEQLDAATELRLKGDSIAFVSRGGLKLTAALDDFSIDVTVHVCLDVGAEDSLALPRQLRALLQHSRMLYQRVARLEEMLLRDPG